jgi:hypothetical protein
MHIDINLLARRANIEKGDGGGGTPMNTQIVHVPQDDLDEKKTEVLVAKMIVRLTAGESMRELILELQGSGLSDAVVGDILGEACYQAHRKEAELYNRWRIQRDDAERMRRAFSDLRQMREGFTSKQLAKVMDGVQQRYAEIRVTAIRVDDMMRSCPDKAGERWGGH